MTVRRLVTLLGLVLAPTIFTIVLVLRAHTAIGQSASSPAFGGGHSLAGRMLLALAAILGVARFIGSLVARLGQPRVIGEMLAGIMLGPSLMGWLIPGVFHWLFTPQVLSVIGGLSQLGLALFMFLVGLELGGGMPRGSNTIAAGVALASVAVPVCGGVMAGMVVYRDLAPPHVDQAVFALFVGVCMSVTAFPVLARILMERGIFHSPLGNLSIVSAAFTDILAWLLLAVVVVAARNGAPVSVARTVPLLCMFAVGTRLVTGRLVTRAFTTEGRRLSESAGLTVVVMGVLVAGAATEALGIHVIFGAFLFGVSCPRGVSGLDRARDKIADLTSTLLLPPFFALVGIRTELAELSSGLAIWLWLTGFLALAVVGKWAASTLSAYGLGVDARSAVRLGVLLNCRGLTELVMLGVGLEMGLLTTTLFTLLVLVTLLTTAMTAPLLALLDRLDSRRPRSRRGPWVRRGEPGDRSPVGDPGHHQDEVASGSSGLPHT